MHFDKINNKGTRDKINKDAIEVLQDRSMIIAMEELAELQQAISKGLRGKLNRDNLCEELADVYIIMQWIIQYYEITKPEINRWKTYKYKRIAQRIKEDSLN